MKKLFSLCMLLALTLTASAQDGLTWWGYYTDQETGLTGTYGLGTYEAAMFVAGDGDMKGISIEAVRAQTRNYSFVKDFKFWVRATLDGENLAEATPAEVAQSGLTTATFDTPYELPAEGAYVGYTFTVYTYDDNEYFSMPVVYGKKPTAQSFYLKKPGETDFTDKSSTGCLTLQLGFKAPAVKTWWGYYTGTEQTGLQGNNKVPGSYEAATFVPGDADLKDTEISAIRIFTRLYSAVTTDAKIWIRSAVDGSNLVEKEFTPSMTSATVELDEPFKIPAEGIYVGYGFRITGWYEGSYEGTPVVYAKKSMPKSFYIMQPGETEFTDMSSKGCLPVQLEVSGGSMAGNAAQVADDLDDMVALVGQPIALTLNLTNQGAAGVKNIDFTYTLDGATKEGHADLATPIDAMIGAKGTAAIELDAPQQAGQQEIEIQITKVNGADNGITGKKSKCSVVVTVISESAPRTAVAEIYYNTTTGYAARAIVGQQQLQEKLGDKVIAFLVDHYNGALNVAGYGEYQKVYTGESTYTNKFTTYPIAEVNRAFTTDPYTGNVAASNSGENHFAADEVVSATLNKVTEASVSLTAEWTDDTKTKANLTANATFMADFKSAPYRLAFVVIMDGLKENISNMIIYYKNAYADDDMEEWRNNPYTNTDYKLNNVAVASSDVNGIQKSLPSKIVAGEANTYTYEMEMPALDGQDEATNARAVVLLINKDTKEIVNAAIAPILTHDEATGISQIENGKLNIEAYDLQGRAMTNGQLKKGLYIVNGKKIIK